MNDFFFPCDTPPCLTFISLAQFLSVFFFTEFVSEVSGLHGRVKSPDGYDGVYFGFSVVEEAPNCFSNCPKKLQSCFLEYFCFRKDEF